MNALQPIESPSYSLATPQRNSRRNSKRLPKTDPGVAVEIGMKLVVNGILSVAAIAALVRLLPYQFTQQAKLQEIRLEVSETEARVNTLRQNFNRYFDPTQAKKVMQEQSPRLDPNQRRVILLPR
jgi:hypothetical protein